MKGSTDKERALGDYVRRRRLATGLSLRQAARRAGIDHTYWGKVELGELRSPNPRYLNAMAVVLEVPPQELFGLAGYYVPEQLPSFGPYLRAKYDLDAEGIAELHRLFEQIRARDGDDADERRAA